ncbi:hypothetical protein [Pontibacter oryzae]|nr:hypothetical protein [Pontibacter oryzae]
MKTRFLLSIFGLLALSACTSDDEPTPVTATPDTSNLCYLQQQVVRQAANAVTTRYTYNEENQIVQSAHFVQDVLRETRKYTYDAAGKLTREELQPTDGDATYTVFSYDPAGKLTKYEVQRPLNLGVVHHVAAFKATYDVQDRLTSAINYRYVDNKLVQNGSFTQSYPAGKPISVVVKDNTGQVAYNATFTQDDQRSPLSAVPAFIGARPAIGFPNTNNLLSVSATTTATTGGVSTTVGVPAESYSAVYTLNEQDYPTKATLTYNDGKVITIDYTYSCEE